MESYSWPGNVRELQNEVERLVVLADEHAKVAPELLSRHIREAKGDRPFESSAAAVRALDELVDKLLEGTERLDSAVTGFHRDLLRATLARCNGNRTHAAKKLGLTRQTLQSRLKTLGLDPTMTR